MSFEEPVEPVARSEAEEPSQFRFRDVAALVFLQCQRFESAARQVATRGLEPGGDIIGNVNGEVHGPTLLGPLPRVKIRTSAPPEPSARN